MNLDEKIQIIELNRGGMSVREISEKTGIPKTTVNRWIGEEEGSSILVCPVCGCKYFSRKGIKRKKFCSDSCRFKWWNSHRDLMKHRNQSLTKCPHCGELFFPKKKGQVFCCRNCYLSEVTKR